MILDKTQLGIDIAASTFSASQQTILQNMKDSYEDIFAQVTTVQRDALTPVNGQIVYNTDNDRYEYWNGAQWLGIGQDLSTPLTVKVDLSAADMLALNGTPITLVAAAGSGYALMPVAAIFRYTYGSVAYTGTYNIVIKNSTASDSEPFMSRTFGAFNSSANRSGPFSTSGNSTSDSLKENDSLVLKADAAISTGDGTLTVWLTYCIIAY